MHNELTQKDIEKMKEEIEYRKLVVRKEALEDVKEARAHGDLSENFEYHAAKKVKNQNESRIRYLELMIRTIRDAGIPAIYVLSQWNRYRVCADFLDWFKGAYPDEAIITMPQSELFPQAGLAGRSVCQMKPDSFPAQQVNQLIGMVEQRLRVGLRLWGKEDRHG